MPTHALAPAFLLSPTISGRDLCVFNDLLLLDTDNRPSHNSKVGVVLGSFTFIMFAALLAFSLHVIVYSLQQAQRKDKTVRSYEALVQVVGGNKLALFMEISMT